MPKLPKNPNLKAASGRGSDLQFSIFGSFGDLGDPSAAEC
jgi:hypothetical protein